MALGVLVVAYLGGRLRGTYETPLTGCARGDGTGGASGLYRWAQRLDIPVRLLEDPVWDASQALPASRGNCVLTMGNGAWSPMGEDPEDADWQKTRAWLARGNALVVVTASPQSLPAALRREFFPSGSTEPAVTLESVLGEGLVNEHPETSTATLTDDGALLVERDGPRWGGPSSPPREKSAARWQLAGDAKGGVLFRVPIGEGALYVLLDKFAWTNAGLDQGQNAPALAGILAREVSGGVLALDEYRHGHGRLESFLTYLLSLPGSAAFLWLAFLWSVLYFYGRNVRLRPVEPYRELERRTAQEHIDAVARLYERARAAPLVVQAVARRLRQISRSSLEHPPSVEAALHHADEYVGSEDRPARPASGMRLVNELLQLRKRIYGTRSVS